MNTSIGKMLPYLAPIVVFGVVAAVWHFVVLSFKVPAIILPGPVAVMNAMWLERWVLLKASWVTLQAASVGLLCSAVFGSLIAVLLPSGMIVCTEPLPKLCVPMTVARL